MCYVSISYLESYPFVSRIEIEGVSVVLSLSVLTMHGWYVALLWTTADATLAWPGCLFLQSHACVSVCVCVL